MIDTTLVALAYVVLAVAALSSIGAVLGLVVAVRDLRRTRRMSRSAPQPASTVAPRRLSSVA